MMFLILFGTPIETKENNGGGYGSDIVDVGQVIMVVLGGYGIFQVVLSWQQDGRCAMMMVVLAR